jgi:hypothetical protein
VSCLASRLAFSRIDAAKMLPTPDELRQYFNFPTTADRELTMHESTVHFGKIKSLSLKRLSEPNRPFDSARLSDIRSVIL